MTVQTVVCLPAQCCNHSATTAITIYITTITVVDKEKTVQFRQPVALKNRDAVSTQKAMNMWRFSLLLCHYFRVDLITIFVCTTR